MNRGLAAAALVAGVVLSAGPAVVPAAVAHDSGRADPARYSSVSEHRYRVVGRIRLALFWTRGETVGSARMTSRATPNGSELTFLLGSDPAWAPRQLNQWSYLREEIGRDHASAFAVRSLTDDDLAEMRLIAPRDGQLFAASCDFVHESGIRSLLTTFDGAHLTYRMFDRLLDQVAQAPQWVERQLPRTPGIAPGLLSAMEKLVGQGTEQARLTRAEPVAYVYDGTLYDLSVRGAQTLGPTQMGLRRFDRLTRLDFAVLNRRTREVTRFAALFAPGAPHSLPVQIIFQPNFWLRVELRLDDDADVPVDPAGDVATLSRIRSVCSDAVPRAAQTATGVRKPSVPRN